MDMLLTEMMLQAAKTATFGRRCIRRYSSKVLELNV